MILSKDGLDKITTTLNMVRFREMYNGLNIGWYQSAGIWILFSGVGFSAGSGGLPYERAT